MNSLRSISNQVIAITIFLAPHLHAAEPADPSVKLREQLRGVLLQLRTVQSEAANAQAYQAAAEAKNVELAEKLTELEKRNASLIQQSNSDKASAERSISELNNKLAEREKRLVLFSEALEKWKAGYEKAAEIARNKEDDRAKLAAEVIVHKRTIADRESKNIALFNVSTEVLNRYEAYALGKAISAREPFIGTTRVKIENLVQGYKDKILDNRMAAASAGQ
jgi:DNA repair exonuclease SbcCD ATPase subunit